MIRCKIREFTARRPADQLARAEDSIGDLAVAPCRDALDQQRLDEPPDGYDDPKEAQEAKRDKRK